MNTRKSLSLAINARMQKGSVLNYPTILRDGNTVAWYDSQDLTTITKSGANLVSRWNDKLKSGRDLIQNGADNTKPTHSANGISFDGVLNFLKTAAFTLIQPEFIYLVLKQRTYTSGDVFVDGNADNGGTIAQYGGTPKIMVYCGGALAYNSNLALNTYGIVRGLFNGANSSCQVNNTTKLVGSYGNANMGGITMGRYGTANNGYGDFEIKEAIFRKVVDSDTDSRIIYDYLKSKYSLAIDTSNLIAISGQSNAIGYYPEDILPIAYKGNQNAIKINFTPLTGSGFQKMNPALNCGYNWIDINDKKNDGWGAEQSAAHDLLTATGNDVVVVKSGFNGGEIKEWDAGLAPYTDLETGLINALNNNGTLYNSYVKLSLLWVQGESDAIAGTTTAYYEAKMRSIITRLRASDARLANLQVVMLKLSTLMTGYGLDSTKRGAINTAFSNIVANTAGTVLLDPDSISGIALRGDNIHYTSASLLLIGSAWKAVMI